MNRETRTGGFRRGINETRRTVVASLAMGMASGCSILFVTSAAGAKRESGKVSDCTTNYTAPVLDSIVTVGEAARTVYAIRQSDAAYQGSLLTRPQDIGLGLLLTSVFAASTTWGYAAVGQCNDEIERENERRRLPVMIPRRTGLPPPEMEKTDAAGDLVPPDAAAQAKAFGEAARAASRKTAGAPAASPPPPRELP